MDTVFWGAAASDAVNHQTLSPRRRLLSNGEAHDFCLCFLLPFSQLFSLCYSYPTHTCYLPTDQSICSSIRTGLVWISLHPAGSFASSLQSLHTQLPFSESRHSLPLLLCFPRPLQDRVLVSLLLLLLLLLLPAPRSPLGIRPDPLGHEQVRLLCNIHPVADKLAAAAKQPVLFSAVLYQEPLLMMIGIGHGVGHYYGCFFWVQ